MMRKNKTTILVSIFIILLFSSTSVLRAQTIGSLKEQYPYVGIKIKDFKVLASYDKQQNTKWCWAACVQMVLNYYNVFITQQKIVNNCFGKVVNRAADDKVMFKALNGWNTDVAGTMVKVSSNAYPATIKEISSFLKSQRPLIVGLSQGAGNVGHAYVLIGMYYRKNTDNPEEKPYSLILVDPWPGNPSIVDMRWDEFTGRIISCYKVWVN
jgi:hypothetical protein